jgi:hypothetical protein
VLEVFHALTRRTVIALGELLVLLVPAQDLCDLLEQLLAQVDRIYPLFHWKRLRAARRERWDGVRLMNSREGGVL